MISRRGFLTTLAAAVAGLAVAPSITPIFEEAVAVGAVGEFIVVTWQAQMLCSYPRHCGVITGISES